MINDLFDALNRSFPAEGIRKESKDFKVLYYQKELNLINALKINSGNKLQTLERSLTWLDSWERNLINGVITAEQFLRKPTAEGLRMTIKSTMALCTQLLDSGVFKYVLTAKMNQDRLEVKEF